MLRRRQPESLTQLALRSIADFVYQMSQQCITTLTNRRYGVAKFYWNLVSSQAHNCNWDELQQFIQPGLPRILASKVSSHLLDTLSQVAKENKYLCFYDAMIAHDCDTILFDMLVLAVIHPCMAKLVLQRCPDSLCLILCKQLHRLTELKVLKIHAIPTKSIKLAVRNVIVSNMGFLRNLVVFNYVKHCTDSVLEVAACHCRQLEHLSVMFSKKVTAQSVESVKKFQNLKTLNIWGTSITKEYCSQLLDTLLKLEDFSSDQEDVLEGVSQLPLVLKSLTTTHFKNSHDLASLCHLSHLTLHGVDCDLICLKALTNLRELAVSNCRFSCIETFLMSRGEQLTLLKLKEVSGVTMECITYCTRLKTLHLSVHSYTLHIDDLSLLHYKNLEHLAVRGYYLMSYDILLSVYTKLKTLKLSQAHVLQKEVIVNAITAGRWKQMEVVNFDRCVKVESLMYIVQNCYNLKKIIYKVKENLESSELLNLCGLETYLKENNLDIELVL
ncbi:uncharacterized protein LOC110830161 isoform X1 [Zootermopsis nevadensis]|nr:uncharacterized protein LOC110830161 isoform X1 [Zootermopsis nevadensis]XP_021920413.1 uncharacterized protein LOC110830161 isoform X2 [Zootermopsis nevadensis]XP_021920414.1 uncharacterized protein LOC110830161 isoform X1 [Zootermopsis nevadensis]XP_021920415.1 uncharacterized protein LOC110830161 isoform X1 [Zootermopsis nevadensis]XP_021920416.1 uncharacterized protein LOC110830161 isoform X1 [Zootermopsis nevadensis]